MKGLFEVSVGGVRKTTGFAQIPPRDETGRVLKPSLHLINKPLSPAELKRLNKKKIGQKKEENLY